MYSAQVAATPNYAAMDISDLFKMSEENNTIIQDAIKNAEAINSAIQAKRQETRTYIISQMKAYGITIEELSTCLPITTPVVEEKSIPAVPEVIQAAPKDPFNDPALKAKYIPKAAQKKAVATEADTKSFEVPMIEDDTTSNNVLPSMDALLSDDPRYAVNKKETTVKRRCCNVPMDTLLSGEPVNRLLRRGYATDPETEKYEQGKRIYDVQGISPTLMTQKNGLIHIAG